MGIYTNNRAIYLYKQRDICLHNLKHMVTDDTYYVPVS
jgi:hypothetical protein